MLIENILAEIDYSYLSDLKLFKIFCLHELYFSLERETNFTWYLLLIEIILLNVTKGE
jgi:hypothetical protein